jgi:crotonobetainyl-CoA:carnitine CoA-transferase CaiB-like acyl-CoA transferase
VPDFLKGVRVLDLSQYLPGPFAARMLADLGAEVVKVEPPAGDPIRSLDAEGKPGKGPIYPLLNAGKTVIRIDLKAESGRGALSDLVTHAHVLIESYRPGVLDKLGFGPDRLKQLNPRLVHCALSGFGQSGPAALAAGHDINYQAMTGALSASGSAEGPVVPFPPVADYAGSMQAVVAVLAALVAAGHGRPGCFLDVSAMESFLSWQEIGMTIPPPRAGGLINGGAAAYQIYRTADGGFVSLSALEPKFWSGFCETIGKPEWVARRFEPMPQTALMADLTALFATRPRDEWAKVLGPADCCFQPVLTYDEVPDHPHIRDRGLVARREDHVEVLLPVYVDDTPPSRRTPFVDGDTEAVLARWRRASPTPFTSP